MSPTLTVRDRSGRRIATLTLGALGLRLAVIGSAVVVVAVVTAAAPGSPRWPALVVLLLAVASAELPDTGAPLLTVTAAAGWWLAVVPEPATGSALVAAPALLVLHVATAHAATGPPGRVADGVVLRAVAARAAMVGAGTLAVGSLALLLDGRAVVPGAVAGALAAVAGLAWLTSRP